MSQVDPVLAFAVCAVVVALLLWGVFGEDPAESIYGEDELEDDEPPPDARAWRDPWGDNT